MSKEINILERTLFARVKKVNTDINETGMYHLEETEVREKKAELFPEGTQLHLIPAHWFGEIRVYRGYVSDPKVFEYFSSDELEPIIPCTVKQLSDLWEAAVNYHHYSDGPGPYAPDKAAYLKEKFNIDLLNTQ